MIVDRKFNSFVENKDLEIIIENSIPRLLRAGIDPNEFYRAIIQNPEILEEGFMGRAASNLRGLGRGIANMWDMGSQAAKDKKYLADLRGMSDDELKNLGTDKAGVDAFEKGAYQQSQDRAKEGWGWSQKGYDDSQAMYQKLRDDRARDAHRTGMLNRLGIDPSSVQPQAPAASSSSGPWGAGRTLSAPIPSAPAANTSSSAQRAANVRRNRGGGGGGGVAAAPAVDTKAMAQQLQTALAASKGGLNRQTRDLLTQLLNHLAPAPAAATPPPTGKP